MEGYSKVANLMGQNLELGIIRRFKNLNMQNLLYLQAELTQLESELRDLEAENGARQDHRRYYAKDWWTLSHPLQEGDDAQWHKMLEVRAKLREYSARLHS